nr:CHC2 zinc finger domain-containing protein [Mucilaginibacter sp. L294]
MPLKKLLGTFAAIFYLMTSSMNLVDIASKYILLQPSRKALKGKCPFHKDETTSLLIIPQSNVFKCFGCGAEGGPMEFLMRIENKNRIKVIADIAEKTFPK